MNTDCWFRVKPVNLWALSVLLIFLPLQDRASVAAESTSTSPSKEKTDQLKLGQQMYMDGLLPSGKLMSATIQGDIPITGKQVSCGACHRRSGLGSSEGQQVVPAVTGDILYKPLQIPTRRPPAPPVLRPAYTDEGIKKAIREGIDANGQKLDPFMPRYSDLTDQELELLLDYLKTLSRDFSPGVTGHEMHFATITVDTVAPETRKALLDVLHTFFHQRNTETRYESKRAENAPWHKTWIFGPYRKWILHHWELTGPRETWYAQLQEYYRKQPVFSVLSGVAPGSWEPMHRFCEDTRIPCLFPTTDLPVISERDFFTLYMSKGMSLESQIVNTHLKAEGQTGKVLQQVYRQDDPKGEVGASALRAAWEQQGGEVREYVIDTAAAPSEAFWQELAIEGNTLQMLWLEKDDLVNLWPLVKRGEGAGRIYLSTALFGEEVGGIPAEARDRFYFVSLSGLPDQRKRLLARSTGWLRFKRIYAPDEWEVQANAYFATKVAGQSVRHIRGFFFGDYLIERIEHMMDNAPYSSVYPRVTLAPGQKNVAKGGYIAKISKRSNNKLTAVTGWIIPH